MGSIYHHHIDSHISSSSSKRGVLCRARVRPVTDTAEAAATESIVAGCLQRWCEGTGGCVQRRFCINVYALPSLLLSRKAAQRRLSQIKHRLSVLAETRNPARRDSGPTTATFALDSPQQNHGDTVASLCKLCMHVLRLPAEELAWLSPLGEQIMVALYPFVGLPSALAGVGVGW